MGGGRDVGRYLFTFAHQRHSEWPRGGSSPSVHRWMIGEAKCGPSIGLSSLIPYYEYYSPFRRSEILKRAPTGMNLEDVRISEISQSQQDKFCKDST